MLYWALHQTHQVFLWPYLTVQLLKCQSEHHKESERIQEATSNLFNIHVTFVNGFTLLVFSILNLAFETCPTVTLLKRNRFSSSPNTPTHLSYDIIKGEISLSQLHVQYYTNVYAHIQQLYMYMIQYKIFTLPHETDVDLTHRVLYRCGVPQI